MAEGISDGHGEPCSLGAEVYFVSRENRKA